MSLSPVLCLPKCRVALASAVYQQAMYFRGVPAAAWDRVAYTLQRGVPGRSSSPYAPVCVALRSVYPVGFLQCVVAYRVYRMLRDVRQPWQWHRRSPVSWLLASALAPRYQGDALVYLGLQLLRSGKAGP